MKLLFISPKFAFQSFLKSYYLFLEIRQLEMCVERFAYNAVLLQYWLTIIKGADQSSEHIDVALVMSLTIFWLYWSLRKPAPASTPCMTALPPWLCVCVSMGKCATLWSFTLAIYTDLVVQSMYHLPLPLSVTGAVQLLPLFPFIIIYFKEYQFHDIHF